MISQIYQEGKLEISKFSHAVYVQRPVMITDDRPFHDWCSTYSKSENLKCRSEVRKYELSIEII